MSEKTLVVLAAGMGSRYGGLKQVDPVGPSGEIILDYSVFDARLAGFDRVVFVIQPSMEKAFAESLGARLAPHISVGFAFQRLEDLPAGFTVPPGREKPWGTTHAVLAAREMVDGPFSVINADDFYGGPAFSVVSRFLDQPGEDFAMAGYTLRRTLSTHGTVSRGICRCDAAGRLEHIEEMTRLSPRGQAAVHAGEDGQETVLTGDELVSMNCWAFRASFMEHAMEVFSRFLEQRGSDPRAECYIPDVIQHLVNSGKVSTRVIPTDSPWFGVTYREDKPLVQAELARLVSEGVYPSPLWQHPSCRAR